MSEHKKKSSPGKAPLLFILILAGLGTIIAFLLRGKNVALFNPKGFIAQEQHNLLVFTVTVLLAIVIPTLIVLFFIARKYRESNTATAHTTPARSNKLLVAGIWLIPTTIMIMLARVMIPATHKLAPRNVITSDSKPLTIQVISLRWKWLFIYPEQKIATVNFVQIPVNTPVTFELTADEAPMSSFWIPNLGGQLYSMTGHVNPLNLMAEEAGDYPGSSAELNGDGFAGMKFTARASYMEDFDAWVKEIRQTTTILDTTAYENLLKPSQNNPVAFFSTYEPTLYAKVVTKYTGSDEGHSHQEGLTSESHTELE